MRSDYEELTSDPEFLRGLRQEELILDVTEVLTRALEDAGVRRSELAERMGKSKGFVSQLFAGGRNLTLRTISDVSLALGVRPRLKLCSDVEWGRYAVSVPLHNWKQPGTVLKYPQLVSSSTNTSQQENEVGVGRVA